ncbi:ABC transporter permease subunit [Infirmifilum lucidum]|uniref:ABC transporter permease subunit n=1 Tax=Infirmifilum lucidum TaxID=2776706 RepID=A0A7L9FKE7_9CREN|nr:ABC transporter permease subunit [Infirmifilum lucidum]
MAVDKFTVTSLPFALAVIAILAGITATLAIGSAPIILEEGVRFVLTSAWDPQSGSYGILPALLGTLYVSALATLILSLLSLGFVAFTLEYLPARLGEALQGLIFYAAALPTVVYGLWGLDAVAPVVRNMASSLFQGGSPTGQSIMTGAVVLAVMNAPYASLIIGEAYRSIPFTYREALYSLGANGFERFAVSWGFVRGAFAGTILLSFGKCVGETTAVSLVVGNSFNAPLNPFEPGITVSSLIVNYATEAPLYGHMLSALHGAALVMLLMNAVFILAGMKLVGFVSRGGGK